MIKISEAIDEIISKNQILTFAFQNRLLNLTKTAEFMKPLIEARTKKEVKNSAILMNLSRSQKRYDKVRLFQGIYSVEKITVISKLSTITYPLENEVIEEINKLYSKIHKQGGYMVVTRGTREITIIVNTEFVGLIEKQIKCSSKYKKSGVTAVGIVFDEKYAEIPGLIYSLIQQIHLQNINIIEIISTYTELVLYVDEEKAKLSFDTIFQCFA